MNKQDQVMFQRAIQAYQQGYLSDAERILSHCVNLNPNNFDILYLLAIVYSSQDKHQEAIKYFRKVIKLSPNNTEALSNFGTSLTAVGNNQEALSVFQKAIKVDHNNAIFWFNAGYTLHMMGQHKVALDYYEKSIALNPNLYRTHFNYAKVLYDLKRNIESLQFYDNAISLKPNFAEPLCNKGVVLNELKRFEEAIAHYDKAINLKPDDYQPWFNKGNTLFQLKCYHEALSSYVRALELEPNNPEIWNNKGNACYQLYRYEESLKFYDNALRLKSNYPDAWCNRGSSLSRLKRHEESLINYDMALSLKPDYAEGWSIKGVKLNELMRYEEAIICYDTALNLKPDMEWAYGDLLHIKMKICDWSDFADSLDNIYKKVKANEKVIPAFPLLSLTDNPPLHKKNAEIFFQDKFPLNLVFGPLIKHPKNEKIRIGYFSADFRNHPVSFLTAELFELHDKNKFEIIAFSFGADDKSPMRLRLSQAFSQFIDVSGISDLEIAKLSRELHIDIAVDLGGYTADARPGIFSYRAAPVQVSYIGYLGTMGAEYHDFLLADKTLIPEELQKFYSEKIAYLPSYQVNDRKRIISDREFTREELGLPETGFVFCCFNNNYKILPSTFDSWMRILNAVEGSALFLYADNEWSKANLIEEAALRGIDGARLIFGGHIPAEEYLARYRVCDLFVDTSPYNAGTTASDALWVGLPVLTLMGQSIASRMAASLLNAIGLPELITNTQAEYEALAIDLAMSPNKLEGIKLKLANNRMTTRLFDTPLFAKDIEAAYIKMYEECQVG